MSRRSHLTFAATLALPVSVVLTSCASSGPSTNGANRTPDVAAFTQTVGSQATCSAIIDALPTTLINEPRITSTGSPYAAVWGNPNIVLRCGVAEPASFTPTAQCLTVNGIDWYLEGNPPPMNGGSSNEKLVVTTVYRTPALQVTVPASYGTQGPSTAMALLTSVINAHTMVSKHCE